MRKEDEQTDDGTRVEPLGFSGGSVVYFRGTPSTIDLERVGPDVGWRVTFFRQRIRMEGVPSTKLDVLHLLTFGLCRKEFVCKVHTCLAPVTKCVREPRPPKLREDPRLRTPTVRTLWKDLKGRNSLHLHWRRERRPKIYKRLLINY